MPADNETPQPAPCGSAERGFDEMSDFERKMYQDSKLSASLRCSDKDCWSGGGIALAMLDDLYEEALKHGEHFPDHVVTVTLTYDADPHMVSLEGELRPWSWEKMS